MQSDKYENTEEAYLSWKSYLESFGIGSRLGIDVSSEFGGWLKGPEYYDRMHGKGRWNFARIISLSFGQGELGLTPMQIANIASSIANKDIIIVPHVVREVEGGDGIPEKYTIRHDTKVAKKHYPPVIDGMLQVTKSGTASHIAIPGINIAGKTGTVQNPHGKNHSAYMAFAPVEDPKIAIAVVVEESGYGASWAAPIAHLMVENYLRPDSVTESSKAFLEKKMMNANLIPYKYRVKQDTSQNGN